MFSNLSVSTHNSAYRYPITDSRLPFAEYIKQCQAIITERRTDLARPHTDAQTVIAANSPFEVYPAASHDGTIKYGVLLIHGLLDCPFTFREISAQLKTKGILSRAVLLPGHGTEPSDLMHITYHDWLQAVRYGIETLKKEVEEVYLVGFSTGAALSIYHALQDSQIAGIILLSPAIKMRVPVDVAASWYHFTKSFGKDRNWVYRCPEDDYVKYKSIPFNGVRQLCELTDAVREMGQESPLQTPVYMILSREDETISSHEAIEFFTSLRNPESRMLLYSSIDHRYPDTRIETRKSAFPELNIAHISHPSIGFSPENAHYGQTGDYLHAARTDKKYIYGAYNHLELGVFKLMAKLRLVKAPRHVLTYNPDFRNMANSIGEFIIGNR